MAGYDLGTAKGTIEVVYDDRGVDPALRDQKRLQDSSRSTDTVLRDLGRTSFLATAAIASGLGLAANVAIDFEKQVSAIGAVSGATAEQMELLRQKALDLGSTTSFSASEAALAMEELVKAGLTVEETLNGAADATVSLAAAGAVALPEAAAIASNAMNAFGLAASDLPKVADLIAGAANASAIDVREFGFSLSQAGAVANLVGLPFEDLAAAIALLGSAGIAGSDAGTSLKTMLQNLQPSTIKQTKLFKELGIITKDGANQFFTAEGNIRTFAEIAGVLQTALAGMTAQQKAATLEVLFGTDAIRAGAIISEAGAAGFQEMADALGAVTAADVAAARLDNTAGAIEALKGSAETAAIEIGTALIPTIRSLAEFLTETANAFTALDPGTQKTILNTLLGIAAALAAVTVAVKVYELAQKAAALASVLWTGVQKTWMAVTKVATAVQWLWNAALTANPIGLLIVGIAALIAGIVLLWQNSETFRKIVIAVWSAVKTAVSAVVDWFVNTVWPFLKMVWEAIAAGFGFMVDLIKKYIDLWMASFEFLVNTVLSIVNRIRDAFTRLREAAVERITATIEFIRSLPGKVLEALGNFGTLLYQKGRDLVQGLIDGIKNMFGRLSGTAKDMVSRITDWLPGSPAKEGPLSGRGYVKYRGEHLVEDFAHGITITGDVAADAVARVLGDMARILPSDTSAAVRGALADVPFGAGGGVTPVVAAAPSRTITIENLNLTGVWDFSDPNAAREIIARLHAALDAYEKEFV